MEKTDIAGNNKKNGWLQLQGGWYQEADGQGRLLWLWYQKQEKGENSLGWECRRSKGGPWVQRFWGPDVTAGAAFSHFSGQC